jgi:hypothetical protein
MPLPTWSWTTANAALATWLGGATSFAADRVRWAHQDAPRPPKPYALLTWTSPAVPVAPQAEDRALANGQRLVIEQYRATLQVDVFGAATPGDAAPYALAGRARSGLALEATRAALESVGLAVLDRGAVRDTSAPQDTVVEGRATFEVSLGYALAAAQDLSWIDSAAWAATYSGG